MPTFRGVATVIALYSWKWSPELHEHGQVMIDMGMKFRNLWFGLALSGALLTPAHASLLVTFDRIDDTTIQVSGSGALDGDPPVGNAHILHFDDTYSSPLTGFVNQNVFQESSLLLGSRPMAFAFSISQDFI